MTQHFDMDQMYPGELETLIFIGQLGGHYHFVKKHRPTETWCGTNRNYDEWQDAKDQQAIREHACEQVRYPSKGP